jgi:serine/threonine protein kinase
MVAGRDTLKTALGGGGMGMVWRAHDAVPGREVAVKEVMIPPALLESERRSAQARVMREARAAARLNHPGVVTLYDVVHDQGHTFIVMELVEAPTLADLVQAEGPLPPWRVAEVGGQLAAALEAAHRAGIVHRDVKPANVMVPAEGGVKLADFGAATLLGDPRLTAIGLVVGSPAYMAPEQASGQPSGPPADLWALGATMYAAVEGEPPFDKGALIPTLAAVVNEDPRPMQRAGPLAPVIGALLAKDPAARPSAPRLRARLVEVARAARPPGSFRPRDLATASRSRRLRPPASRAGGHLGAILGHGRLLAAAPGRVGVRTWADAALGTSPPGREAAGRRARPAAGGRPAGRLAGQQHPDRPGRATGGPGRHKG